MKNLFLLAAAALLLAACSPPPPPPPVQVTATPQYEAPAVAPVVVAQPAPVVIQQAPAHDGFLTGMLLGHALSGGGGGYGHHTTVVNKTVVNRTTVVRPSRPSRSRR